MADAPACACGSRDYDYGLVMFPMVWMAVCLGCGVQTACHLKPAKEPPKPTRPQDYDHYDDYWPFG